MTTGEAVRADMVYMVQIPQDEHMGPEKKLGILRIVEQFALCMHDPKIN